jgi:lysozyme
MAVLERRWVRWSISVLAVLVVAGLAGYQFFEPGWRYSVRGVDVSHHQGSIDWAALATDQTDFAYIKATEGRDWTDTRFTENWRESAEAGVVRGAYHFYTLCTPGIDQATHMIATVPNEEGMLPPAVDLEFGGNCSARPEVESFRAELNVFLEKIQAHYGKTPVIYTNGTFYNHYLAHDPPDVIWWIMSPIIEPLGEPSWTFWQHFPGHRDGVVDRVDRNTLKGDITTLKDLAEQEQS